MIIIPLMLAAASPAETVAQARQAYASCLGGFTRDAVDRKMERGAFLAELKTKCADKESAFRAALMVSDKADGMTTAESTEDADDQIAEYIDKMTSDFDSGG